MDYKEVKIYLHTNLESLPEDKRTILFESSQLHHPEITNRAKFKKYPSISREATQNYAALSELTYQQKMEFFFNPNSNLQLLRIHPNLFNKKEKKYNTEKSKEYFKKYNAVIKKNIEIMLTLLFVASPLNGVNVSSSWEFITDKMQIPRLPSPYGFFVGVSNVSSLEINKKKYSFDRLIWMNDILNCPVYSNLFLRYRSFLRWRENEYKKITAIHNDQNGASESSAQKKKQILDDMLKKTTKNIYDAYNKAGLSRDAQYSYFIDQYIRNLLSYQNKSTNRILQELINLQGDNEVEKFFNFMERAYKYFYEGIGEPFKENEDETYWLYTGVNEKYESQNIENIWEIHVLCDLYLGTSGKLYGKQNCELKGQELGKNLELVLTENVDTPEKNRQKWDLSYRRILYSEKDEQENDTVRTKEHTDKQKQDANNKPTANPTPTNLNPNLFQQVIDTVEDKRKKHYEEKEEKLTDAQKKEEFNRVYPPISLGDGSTTPTSQLEKIWYPDHAVPFMTEINSIFRNHANLRDGQPEFLKSNILGILHNSKDKYEKELYEAYVKFNENLFLYNRKVIDKLTDLQSLYNGQIKSLRRKQEEFLRTQNAETSEQFLKLSLLCSKYYFYSKIIDELIQREDKKQKLNAISMDTPLGKVAAAGGGKKRRYKTRRSLKDKKRVTRKHKLLRRKR
jgi:hypothetical protein